MDEFLCLLEQQFRGYITHITHDDDFSALFCNICAGILIKQSHTKNYNFYCVNYLQSVGDYPISNIIGALSIYSEDDIKTAIECIRGHLVFCKTDIYT